MEFHFWPTKTGCKVTAALDPLSLPFSLPLFSSPSTYSAILPLICKTSNQHSLFCTVIRITEAQASSRTHADLNLIYSGLMSGDSTTKTHNRLSVLLGLQFLVMLLRTYIALIQIFYLMFSRMNIFGSLSVSFITIPFASSLWSRANEPKVSFWEIFWVMWCYWFYCWWRCTSVLWGS